MVTASAVWSCFLKAAGRSTLLGTIIQANNPNKSAFCLASKVIRVPWKRKTWQSVYVATVRSQSKLNNHEQKCVEIHAWRNTHVRVYSELVAVWFLLERVSTEATDAINTKKDCGFSHQSPVMSTLSTSTSVSLWTILKSWLWIMLAGRQIFLKTHAHINTTLNYLTKVRRSLATCINKTFFLYGNHQKRNKCTHKNIFINMLQ